MAGMTFLPDYEDTEPPSHSGLRVTTSGDLTFIDLVKPEQTNKADTYERIETVAVPTLALLAAIGVHNLEAAIAKAARGPVKDRPPPDPVSTEQSEREE